MKVLRSAVLILPWLLPRPGIGGEIPYQPFDDSAFVEVLGSRLHYRVRLADETRAAPLVILLHGFGGSSFLGRG